MIFHLEELDKGITFRHLFGIDFLRTNSFPLHFGRLSKEGSNLRAPPTCMLKEELIKFPKEQVELGMAASMC
jgi:hypothetical protein